MAIVEKLKNLPKKPGVYLFKDSGGEILYVGKAKNLRNRVNSYFIKNYLIDPRINLMLREVRDLDYVIVSSEVESLVLENNFIKQYQPRFNVRLRDDKNYQFIKIDYSMEIPQVYPVRRIEDYTKVRPLPFPSPSLRRVAGGRERSKYFGPYTSGQSVKSTLKLVRRIFGLCTNKKASKKACFHYHIGRCPGVCIGLTNLPEYKKRLRLVENFLNHKHREIIIDLKKKMREASQARLFEKAAILRDKLRSLEEIWEKQKIVSPRRLSQDYFSLFQSRGRSVVNLFMVREGKLIHQEFFEAVQTQHLPSNSVLTSFIKQYYADASNIPKEIIVREFVSSEKAAVEKWLHIKIILPKRGKKSQFLKLGEENAGDYYEKSFAQFEKNLADLQKLLKLPRLPGRIEAYDISNIQGMLAVGSMVVFENGLPKKSDYRKFKISRTVSAEALAKADDVAMMREMLERRFKHVSTSPHPSPGLGRETFGQERSPVWAKPDLIIIDGGRGQLNAALSVLKKYNLKIPTIGLAKRLEEIFVPGKKRPIRLPKNSPVLFLLERIRDEAHRFAITFYRGRHAKEQTRSRLDEIPGIGPLTKKKLLQKFGTVTGIRSASLEAVAREVGMSLAKRIKEML